MLNIIDKVYNFNRSVKKIILIFIDLNILFLAFLTSLFVKVNNFTVIFDIENIYSIFLFLPVTILSFINVQIYTTVIRYITIEFIIKLIKGIVLSSVFILFLAYIFNVNLPNSLPVTYFVTSFILIFLSRILIRSIYLKINLKNLEKVAIFGTNINALVLNEAMEETYVYRSVIFFSQNTKFCKGIDEKKVYSFTKNFSLIKELDIDIIYVTEKVKDFKFFKKIILEILKTKPLQIKFINDFNEIYNDNYILQNFRNANITELLVNDKTLKVKNFKNINSKNILVTGAGGSIGNALCEQIIRCKPKNLILIDHSEFSLYQLHENITRIIKKEDIKINLKFTLGTIQNKQFLKKVFSENKIDFVFHSAAYKHVPIVEENIIESLENNVFSTQNLLDVSINHNVTNFVLISSDKAVKPTNIMGASKRLAELICQSYISKNVKTKISIVRFGNVINSSGSVIPMFEKQIKKQEPISLTHLKIERYFMSLQEATSLVLQTIPISKGGEVFLLDMGKSIKILDLAKMMIHLNGKHVVLNEKQNKNINNFLKIKVIGLRPGEKMFEELSINPKLTQTGIKNILIANDPTLNKKDVNNILDNLKRYGNQNNVSKIINTLKNGSLHFKD